VKYKLNVPYYGKDPSDNQFRIVFTSFNTEKESYTCEWFYTNVSHDKDVRKKWTPDDDALKKFHLRELTKLEQILK
jgi:hypothetical protein